MVSVGDVCVCVGGGGGGGGRGVCDNFTDIHLLTTPIPSGGQCYWL